MDNNLRNHRAAEDGSVLRENLEGRDKSKTFNDDFSSTSQTTSENIFPLHLREDSHDIWLHPSTKTLPNPIKTTGVSLVGVLNPSVDNHSSTESSKADDLVCHGRTKLIERSLVSQRPSSGCSSKSFEVLKWVATQENSPNKFHLEQCHSIHTEIDDHSSGTFLNEDQLRPSFGSQMPFPNYHLNSDKEDVISTFVEEVRHLRQEISSQTSKQEALETLMQKALVELEEANANIMKLRSEIARSTSDDKMTITSIQSSLNILKNEIAQDSFKRTEEISKLETKFSDSQQALEQIEVILIKNEVTSGQRVEVENSLKADLQEVQNKLSALLRDKDAILPNWASFSHAVGTPAQLVPIMQQPVPSEIARKALSIIDPTTDKETSKTELACQSRTESTSEEPRQPDNSEQIKVGLENMVIATFEEPAVADVPSTEESSNKDQMDTFTSFWPFVNGTLIVCNLTLDCEEFSPKDVVYAVNCGGDYFKDSHGINYQSDKSSSGIASDFGKQFLVFGRVSQSDSVLYQTEKYDHNTFGYDVPLDGDGDYVLVLKFSEVYWNSPGAKVFGVLLNNRHRVISDLDIYEKVGKAVAHDEYIPFSVQNGKMNFNGESSTVYDSFRLDFLKGEVENPKINAFYLYKGDIKDVPRLPPLSSAVK
ncbi:hypothetical protein QYM36_004852 [Artemia franciscana]|uniref:Malectin domain-containing protein n=1 Tax=Artemia franciscana TaxID=6661 RepID=A0AA88HW41_ARTSF|nr:hypothetical protein QYM36_004852 [Artemia franciscana]